MRVLIFSLAYHPVIGGAEVAIKELTDRLPEIEFDLVTVRFDAADPAREKLGNVSVFRLGGGRSYINKILFVPRAALLARKLSKAKKYDWYWAMMSYMTFPVVLARMMGDRTPYILTLQDGDPFERVFERWRIRLFKPLLVYGFRHAAVIQPISNFLAAWARKMGYQGRIEMIPNGVDTRLFSSDYPSEELAQLSERLHKKTEDVFLITTSRLFEKNGISDVIDALRFLPAHIKFLILGVGPLEPQLRAQIKSLGLESRVRLLGHVDNAETPKFLKVSDIFIRPSLSEGQGISFIEAMAAGLPVIATPVGGIPDFLFDPEANPGVPPTGLFVPPRQPQLIAFQVQKLLSDRVLRDTLVINARRMVEEKYDWNLIAEEMRSKVFNL